ncbi:MAG: sugar ABC transporter substrate-binding protein [Eubacteriales bacterium]|nr:sugar ABC transporter substrate-binding protein [Eubacteriales bacterium]
MKKRLFASLIASCMVLTACGSSSGASAGTAASGSSGSGEAAEKWTIGYINRDDADTYLKSVVDEFQVLCDADDSITLLTADSAGDAQTQMDQIDNYITQEVDAMVIVCQDGDAVAGAIKNLNESGTPVFCSSQAATGGDFTFVGVSDYAIGMAQCEWAHDNLPEGAKVLYLGGNLGYQTSIDRRQAVVDGLAERLKTDFDGNIVNENGDIEVLSWQECMYTMEDGMSITEDWIQTFSDFDAIIAVNDRSALGALEALTGAGLTDKMVIGLDGLDDAIQCVADGTMAATVLQSASMQAQALYDAVKTAQSGGENPAQINPDPIVIDSSNVNDYLK